MNDSRGHFDLRLRLASGAPVPTSKPAVERPSGLSREDLEALIEVRQRIVTEGLTREAVVSADEIGRGYMKAGQCCWPAMMVAGHVAGGWALTRDHVWWLRGDQRIPDHGNVTVVPVGDRHHFEDQGTDRGPDGTAEDSSLSGAGPVLCPACARGTTARASIGPASP